MNVVTYPVGKLQANCYFLINDKDCLVIDPGDSADFLLEEVSRNNYNVKAIIATHGHFDHVMGAGEMQLALNVPFYMNLNDEFLIKRLEETARHFLGYEPHVIKPQKIIDICHPERSAAKSKDLSNKRDPSAEPALSEVEGVGMTINPFSFYVIETPGHTPGSICLYFEKDQTIFTGDALFKDGIGRYDFSYSDKKELFRSLYELFKLPEETLVYSGHGDPTTIGEERQLY